jgi:minor capsid protein
MALWLDELMIFAQTNSVGTIGTNLFRFNLQDGPGVPDAQVALIPYGGMPAQQAFGSDVIKWEFPRCQVMCRAAKGEFRAAYQKAEDAYRAFAKISAESLSGTFYHSVTCLQPPFFLDTDTNERPRFAFNLAIEKELSA